MPDDVMELSDDELAEELEDIAEEAAGLLSLRLVQLLNHAAQRLRSLSCMTDELSEQIGNDD